MKNSKPRQSKTKSKRFDRKLLVAIVEKFCKEPIIWPKEVKLAKDLLNKYPNVNFIRDVRVPDWSPRSLAFLLSEAGQKHIKKEVAKSSITLKSRRAYTLSNRLLGESRKIDKKPKTLFDFINYAKERK